MLLSQYDQLPLALREQIAKPTSSHLCKRARHLAADAVFSLLLRCYSAVLLAVIPSFLPTPNQGFCGEPGFDG
jgi:hypothetical protein